MRLRKSELIDDTCQSFDEACNIIDSLCEILCTYMDDDKGANESGRGCYYQPEITIRAKLKTKMIDEYIDF